MPEKRLIKELNNPACGLTRLASYTYDNTAEVLAVIKNNPKREGMYMPDVFTDSYYSKSWVGVPSAEVLEDLLNYGEQSKARIKEMNDALANVNLDDCKLPKIRGTQYSLAGGCVSVPRMLSGNPLCMMRSRRVNVKEPVFHFILNTSVLGDVSKSDVAKCGRAIARAIAKPLALGYKVRFTASRITKQDTQVSALNVCIKREDEPLNLQRFLMPILEVCFPRGLCFSWIDHHPEASEYSAGGNGSSLKSRDGTQAFRKEIYSAVSGDTNPIVINMMDLVKLLERSDEDTVERFVQAQIEEPESRMY